MARFLRGRFIDSLGVNAESLQVVLVFLWDVVPFVVLYLRLMVVVEVFLGL